MSNTPITFIGGGNMARSLIAGLIANGHNPDSLRVSEPEPTRRTQLSTQFGVRVAPVASDIIDQTKVIVLCVKPQCASQVCQELKPLLKPPFPLCISIMAGVSLSSLARWLDHELALVRAMPNTPAMLQAGAIGLYANTSVNGVQRNLAEEILRACGLTRWVNSEADIDAVTAISGSGPAYFLLLMEALEHAGIAQGLEPQTARLLTIQTALGAARMAVESNEAPHQLRSRVTSPGGTTEQAIATLEAGDLSGLIERAVAAAYERAVELSNLFAEPIDSTRQP
jgi:pyrroline-5-carboxylate reductase